MDTLNRLRKRRGVGADPEIRWLERLLWNGALGSLFFPARPSIHTFDCCPVMVLNFPCLTQSVHTNILARAGCAGNRRQGMGFASGGIVLTTQRLCWFAIALMVGLCTVVPIMLAIAEDTGALLHRGSSSTFAENLETASSSSLCKMTESQILVIRSLLLEAGSSRTAAANSSNISSNAESTACSFNMTVESILRP